MSTDIININDIQNDITNFIIDESNLNATIQGLETIINNIEEFQQQQFTTQWNNLSDNLTEAFQNVFQIAENNSLAIEINPSNNPNNAINIDNYIINNQLAENIILTDTQPYKLRFIFYDNNSSSENYRQINKYFDIECNSNNTSGS